MATGGFVTTIPIVDTKPGGFAYGGRASMARRGRSTSKAPAVGRATNPPVRRRVARRGPVPWPAVAGVVVIGVILIVIAAFNLSPTAQPGDVGQAVDGATPWVTFGTRDVHSLAF